MDILHPLNEIVPYREQNDRLEIEVHKDCDKKALLTAIQKEFESKLVINGDINAIRKAIVEASGEYVDVGPQLVMYNIETDTFMILTTTPLSCTLLIKEDIFEAGIRPSVPILKHRLKRAGVVYGVDTAKLEDIIDRELWETPIQIAEGKEPIKGKNGTFEYKVNTEAIYTPKIGEDGIADYRDIQSFTQVNRGDLIAVRIPEGEGTPGKSIFGDEIPAERGAPYELRAANNVIVTADKNELRAELSGIILKKDGVVSVKSDLEIDGDVDFKVGNIKFTGRVIINGDVLPGFTIESESDIIIHGQVEASKVISAEGSVLIEKGVIGKDNAIIKGKKQVQVNFAQDTRIESEGIVLIESSLLHSNVICSTFKTLTPAATIIGGSITAFKSIEIASSGNPEETKTSLIVMDETVLELIAKRKKLSEALTQLNALYVPAEREVRNKTAMLKKFGDLATKEQVASLDQIKQKFKTIKMKTELVEKNIATIDVELKREDILEGDIFINGDLYPGTQVEIHKKRKIIKDKNRARHYMLTDGELDSLPIK